MDNRTHIVALSGGKDSSVRHKIMIAALFVEKNGCYFNLPDIDCWDEERDARKYPGSYPVVAHPPCQRWGKMWTGQPSWIKKTGQRKKKGDDGGCFASAIKGGGKNSSPRISTPQEFRDLLIGIAKTSNQRMDRTRNCCAGHA